MYTPTVLHLFNILRNLVTYKIRRRATFGSSLAMGTTRIAIIHCEGSSFSASIRLGFESFLQSIGIRDCLSTGKTLIITVSALP